MRKKNTLEMMSFRRDAVEIRDPRAKARRFISRENSHPNPTDRLTNVTMYLFSRSNKS